jgi:hypothetical protein
MTISNISEPILAIESTSLSKTLSQKKRRPEMLQLPSDSGNHLLVCFAGLHGDLRLAIERDTWDQRGHWLLVMGGLLADSNYTIHDRNVAVRLLQG